MTDTRPERSRRMPKGKATKKTSLKPSPIKVGLLLAQFILIKLGQVPLWLIKSLYKLALIQLPMPSLPSFRQLIYPFLTLLSLPLMIIPRRHRGRPRKDPLIVHLVQKLKYFLRFKISPKIKFGLTLTSLLTILAIYTYSILTAAYQLPSPTRLASPDQPLTTEFYDRNNKLLYRLYEGRNRSLITLKELPAYFLQATISIEDKNFYKHNGVDPTAILRALYHNNQSKDTLEGASTLTQQLVKNSLLSPEKTYIRKVKEIILAIWAESIYSKDQILQMYVNNAPYGGTNWGVEAASRAYFGKSASKLSLGEAAFLAGLPAAPSTFSPYSSNPTLGKIRQREVLQRMVEDKYISKQQSDEAFAQRLDFQPQETAILAPHFVMYVKDYLEAKYGPRIVAQGGLKVYTTVDLGLQENVQKIVNEEVNKLTGLNVHNGAAMVTDPKTGQILAMVGSKDYHDPEGGNFNVTTALRQPGSSIKPITYVTAFKKGYSPGNTVLDAPVVFSDEWGNSYAPVNYDGRFHGPVSIRTALGSSLNIPAVKMLATIGIDPVIQTARDLGITTFTDPKSYGLSLTLGGAAVKMTDMMSMYGALSQNGTVHPITPILKVTDSTGNILEQYEDHPNQALQPELSYMITSILVDNNARIMAFGPNSLLNLPGVAVKTGTTDSKRDNWAFGYTPDFVVGVWVGNNDNSPMNQTLASGITGATPIWNRLMKGVLAADPNTAFQKPSGIVDVVVDGRKDIAVANILPKALVQSKTDKEQTRYFDAFSSYATSTASLKDNFSN